MNPLKRKSAAKSVSVGGIIPEGYSDNRHGPLLHPSVVSTKPPGIWATTNSQLGNSLIPSFVDDE